MVAHNKSTRSRMNVVFPRCGIHKLRILISEVVASAVKFVFVVEEDDRFSERTEQISSNRDEQRQIPEILGPGNQWLYSIIDVRTVQAQLYLLRIFEQE